MPEPIALLHTPVPVFLSVQAAWLAACSAVSLWLIRERRNKRSRSEAQQSDDRERLYRAYHDSETGLPNLAALELELSESVNAGKPLSCLYLRLDGSCSPTQAVQPLVNRLQQVLQPEDKLVRVRSERFAVLTDRNHDELAVLAQKLIAAIYQPQSQALDGRTAAFEAHVGIASYPADAATGDALLTCARRAAAVAKTEANLPYLFAHDSGNALRERTRKLSNKLQRALLDGHLQLVYQPIFNGREQMVAVEALARWHDAEEGNISPGEFVPVAENTGLIVPFSNWVLRQACGQMAAWNTMNGTLERIAVNVSVKHVARSDFAATVQRVLAESGLPPSQLELELTEGALAENFEPVKQNLQTLRSLGVRISIDDFGTGYSSLSRVHELDADVLKIDRAFVQGASESRSGAAMVQTIIEMAHTLQLSVIAEGVETQDQLKTLRGMACDEIQGFLLGRPQPSEAISARLRAAGRTVNHLPDLRPKLVPRVA